MWLDSAGKLLQNVIKVFIEWSPDISKSSSEAPEPKSPARVDRDEGDVGQGPVLVDKHGVGPVDAHVARGVRRGVWVRGGVNIDLDIRGEGGIGKQSGVACILLKVFIIQKGVHI